MTADIITLRSADGAALPVGRITFAPASSTPPSPHVQHYQDLARLAWFDRLVLSLQDADRVFSSLASADEEYDCLTRIREVLAGVKDL